jgi:hypothetical protein
VIRRAIIKVNSHDDANESSKSATFQSEPIKYLQTPAKIVMTRKRLALSTTARWHNDKGQNSVL